MQTHSTNVNPIRFPHGAVSGRITALLNIFRDGQSHKAAELAQRIGVNSRTIRRTLHLMRDEMGIPLIAGRDGFQMQNFEQIPIAAQSTPEPEAHTRFWQRETAPLNN